MAAVGADMAAMGAMVLESDMAAMGAVSAGGTVSQPIPILHDAAAREPSAAVEPLSPPPLTSAAQEGGADGGLALSDPYGIPSRISDLTARTCESKSCTPEIHVRVCATDFSNREWRNPPPVEEDDAPGGAFLCRPVGGGSAGSGAGAGKPPVSPVELLDAPAATGTPTRLTRTH